MSVIVVVLVVLVAAVALALASSAAWRRSVNALLDQLGAEARAHAMSTSRFFTEQVAQLPAPVQRYFAFALSPGQPVVVTARTSSQGEFRMSPDGGWHPFTASQSFSASPPAFVWDAAIDVGPLVTVRVTDQYIHGEGAIRARAASLVTVAEQHGTPELASGELLRYLAEAVLMPTALLPMAGVQWTPLDDFSAIASLTDGNTTARATFHFGPRGEVSRITAMRYRDVHGEKVLTPWEGQFREYHAMNGMMIPMFGEVAWILPTGSQPYYRGRTTQVAYEVAA
jgi:hypothetical protein